MYLRVIECGWLAADGILEFEDQSMQLVGGGVGDGWTDARVVILV